MPFATQFALSLEATSLVPLALTAANKAAGALMNLARDLQNSGSDIVVEEDLANAFGRSHIAPQFASSFKTIILEHREATPLVEGIFIQSGPGPTVTRALKHPPYFSMVVQLSLLAWVHRKDSLAGAIKQILEKRLEGAPAGEGVQAVPSQHGLLGVIRACEEQTASYEWNKLLSAVASLLALDQLTYLSPLSSIVLGGLLDMFVIVQSLPENRLIFVSSSQGTCVLCVWAHHVLGLTVLVRLKDTQDIRLGVGNEQVIVDCREPEGCSVSLLDCDGGDILISIRQDEEDLRIDATYKLPIQGYGRAMLPSDVHIDVVEEMMRLIVAIALVVSKHLLMEDGLSLQIIQRTVEERKIFEAAQLLFNKPTLTREAVNPYIKEHKKWRSVGHAFELLPDFENWASNDSFPGFSRSYLSGRGSVGGLWKDLLAVIHCIVLLILTFAHVQDLNVCANLPLGHFSILFTSPLYTDLASWNGKSKLALRENTWFSAITALMCGHMGDQFRRNACLLSNHGWSFFISTFNNADPVFIDPGYVSVVRGVPCRHGIHKTGILDGPGTHSISEIRTAADKAGDVATLRCGEKVEQRQIQCGEQNDHFILSIRLNTQGPTLDLSKSVSEQTNVNYGMVRTGYREYHQALWCAQRSTRCEHSPQKSQDMRLPPDSLTVPGIAYNDEYIGINIIILLTARNRFARWRALVTTSRYRARQILLRGDDCCFACVVDQAASQPGGRWWIIL